VRDAELKQLLRRLAAGEIDEAAAFDALRGSARLGFATVDLARGARCGFPEVVFAEGKSPADTAAIAARIHEHGQRVLITRATEAQFEAVASRIAGAVYHERARCITGPEGADATRVGHVAVLSAGTSDIPVAEEARVTAETLGAEVTARYDVGVAGLHRLAAEFDDFRSANVAVVVAGMEGALPSVVGGLFDRPVIAVPTSIGYGASFGGLAALLGMLNSCAAGVSVVNIDNGFGAGYLAALINRLAVTGDSTKP